MYEMQPIYMNATTCRMLFLTWLKVNKSFKNKYELVSLIQIIKMKYK